MNEDSTVEQALAGGAPQHFGWYRFFFDDERWEWSPEVARIHGYEPGSVTPTTRLVLSHKHPDDYEQVAATLEDIRRTLKPFSTRHRIITVQGATREVVVIGERMHDNTGQVVGTQGFYIDVTPISDFWDYRLFTDDNAQTGHDICGYLGSHSYDETAQQFKLSSPLAYPSDSDSREFVDEMNMRDLFQLGS